MKLKYYLRGLGIGIICTAIIMGIALSGSKKETMTDTEIIERARLLGMVMPEDAEQYSETEEGQQSPEAKTSNPDGTVDSEREPVDKEAESSKADNNVTENNTDDEPESGKQETDQTDNAENQEDGNGAQQSASQEMVQVEIQKGDFSDTVSRKLFQAGLISDAEAFNKYLTQKGADQNLHVGVYQIPAGATQDEIIDILQK